MNTTGPNSDPAAKPRLFASLRQLGLTLLAMGHTRLALAGVELEEELQRLIDLLLNMLGLLVFGLVGVLMVSLLLVLMADPAQRVLVLAILSASYLALGVWFWWRIARAVATRPPFLQATLAEMAQDRAALQATSTPAGEASRAGL